MNAGAQGMQAAEAGMVNDQELLRETGRQSLVSFLRDQTCYKMLRKSGRVVVFDTKIPVQLAFYALVEHNTPVAPLWDDAGQAFVGALTKFDFIDIMRDYLRRGRTMEEMASFSIKHVMEDAPPGGGPYAGARLARGGEFGAVEVEASVLECCQRMFTASRHRFLGVVVPGEVTLLAMVSCVDVLKFLVEQFREQRRLFDDSVVDLGIGTYKNLISMQEGARLYDVLDLMEQHDVAAVPIMDATGRMVGAYHRSDIAFIAHAPDAQTVVQNLELSVGEIMHAAEARRHAAEAAPSPAAADGGAQPPPVINLLQTHDTHTCRPGDSLQRIFELFAEVTVERVFVVDDDRRCLGIISARDLVGYLMRGRPGGR